MLDVATAEVSVEDLQLTDAYAESAWLEYNLMAWAPDSRTAYCVCHDGQSVGVWSITVGDTTLDTFYSQVADLAPAQISAGAGGVAVQLEPGGTWHLLAVDAPVGQPLVTGDAFALSSGGPSVFAVTRDGTYGIRAEDASGENMASSPLPAGPVSSLHALRGLRSLSRPESALPGEPPPPHHSSHNG